jgi:amidase
MDAGELSAAIHSKKVSCREVMQATLNRVNAINPRFNAIVALQDEAGLLAQADDMDARLANGQSKGWLHGIPQAPKDLMHTKGIASTLGSRIFKDAVPDFDSLTVERAKAAGAIIIGKTNTPEFGLGSQTYNAVYGATKNAYNDTLCAGGSSGGAAVALALNMLAVADGSDMMGSLRNPAAFNNGYGFRPSAGRVPQAPAPDLFVQQLGVSGPMGRTPQDCARLLATQAGSSERFPLSLAGDGSEYATLADYKPANSKPLAGKRVGWLADMGGYLPMEPGVLERCELGLAKLESLGASIEPAQMKYPPEQLWETWLTLRQGLQGGNLSTFYKNEEQRALLKPEAIWETQSSLGATAADFFQASSQRTRFYESMLDMYRDADFFVLPTAQVFPFDVNTHWPKEIAGRTMDTYHRWMEVVLLATMAGLPAMNLPIAPSVTDGNATDMAGIQLIGGPLADEPVLRASIDFASAS